MDQFQVLAHPKVEKTSCFFKTIIAIYIFNTRNHFLFL